MLHMRILSIFFHLLPPSLWGQGIGLPCIFADRHCSIGALSLIDKADIEQLRLAIEMRLAAIGMRDAQQATYHNQPDTFKTTPTSSDAGVSWESLTCPPL